MTGDGVEPDLPENTPTPVPADPPSDKPRFSQGRRGAPSKFTEATRNKILQALRAGSYRSVAAEYADISDSTLRAWLKLAEDPDNHPEHYQFGQDVLKAEADNEIRFLARMNKAAEAGKWQADLELQSRKHPERWGRKDRLQAELSGPGGTPLDVRHGVDTTSMEALALALAVRGRQRQDPLAVEDGEDWQAPEDLESFRVQPGEIAVTRPSLYPRPAIEASGRDAVAESEPGSAPAADPNPPVEVEGSAAPALDNGVASVFGV